MMGGPDNFKNSDSLTVYTSRRQKDYCFSFNRQKFTTKVKILIPTCLSIVSEKWIRSTFIEAKFGSFLFSHHYVILGESY